MLIKDKLSYIRGLLYDCIYNYIASKRIYKELEGTVENKEFWKQMNDNALMMAYSCWCMVFGTNSNETHWKKIGFDNCLFQKKLLENLGFDESSWQEYWENMLHFRNNFIAHRNINIEQRSIPFFDKALQAISSLDEFLKSECDNFIFYDTSFEEFYKLQEDSLDIIIEEILDTDV